MLVMSRMKNESITINDEIVVTVVEVRHDKVRLGITAPREASVHRSEIYEAIHQQPDDPYRTVVEMPKIAPVDDFDTIALASNKARHLRLDPSSPLESLKSHLLTVLGTQQFDQIKPLLDQLTESKGMSVK